MKKIDRRRKYYIVVDVETAGGLGNPLVYDIGFAITDKHGNIYEKHSYMIKEIWENRALMLSAYYAEKIPKYEKDIANGTRKIVTFMEMRNIMLSEMRKYKVEVFGAYNSIFDTRALSSTMRFLTENKKAKFLTEEFKNIEQLCIWCLACENLYTQVSFRKMAIRNNWLTDANNFRTSAEIGYRFLTGNVDFIEEHTGLEDVLIEIEIMVYALRQNKKRIGGVFGNPWKIPNSKELNKLK